MIIKMIISIIKIMMLMIIIKIKILNHNKQFLSTQQSKENRFPQRKKILSML